LLIKPTFNLQIAYCANLQKTASNFTGFHTSVFRA